MVRVIAFFVGLGFAGVLLISLFSGIATEISNPPAPLAATVFHEEPKALHLASDGPFGKFDKKQVQRGFQVYAEVCSACHRWARPAPASVSPRAVCSPISSACRRCTPTACSSG